ncbi:transcription factor bHLH61-like isoform X3 [Curcuma longa]|uniref:transcription factor bHLH61-like isoform X3 n=1 Tax=Curcuma longa TaxID=136217 RepID=UPI003D9EAD8F
MVSREHKRAALHEKLQLLRAVTHSHALNKTSILRDASKYIEELKKKVDKLNQEIACTQSSIRDKALPDVTVETLQRGFLINVSSVKSYPGLLVSVLEAFDQLGLSVVQARAACTDTFHLEVVGGDITVEAMDAHVVKQAVLHAIKACSRSNEK